VKNRTGELVVLRQSTLTWKGDNSWRRLNRGDVVMLLEPNDIGEFVYVLSRYGVCEVAREPLVKKDGAHK